MKKQPKKLSLARTTLRLLSRDQLANAAGGAPISGPPTTTKIYCPSQPPCEPVSMWVFCR